MMLAVLVSGTLIRDPQSRQGRNGRPFVTALMRCPCEKAEPVLLSLIAFAGGAQQALLALRQGDALSVAGRAKLSSWEGDGEQRHGLSVVADQVLTAYHLDKRRRQVSGADER